MFGLSTMEVEFKNVFIAFQNEIIVYYEFLKNNYLKLNTSREIDINSINNQALKIYREKAKNSLFIYLRTQYPNFDSKFNTAIANPMFSDISDESITDVVGLSAGQLFFYIYFAIKGQPPKTAMCIALNQKEHELYEKVLRKIDSENN